MVSPNNPPNHPPFSPFAVAFLLQFLASRDHKVGPHKSIHYTGKLDNMIFFPSPTRVWRRLGSGKESGCISPWARGRGVKLHSPVAPRPEIMGSNAFRPFPLFRWRDDERRSSLFFALSVMSLPGWDWSSKCRRHSNEWLRLSCLFLKVVIIRANS